MTKRGKFIVFEGIDGCGKSTQLKILAQQCRNRNIPIHTTQEPSKSDIGNLIRYQYMTGKRSCDSMLMSYLLTADRYEHITNPDYGILKLLNDGINVLCGYYVLAGIVRQSLMDYDLGKEIFQKTFRNYYNMNKDNLELLFPDMTIYIEEDPDIAYKRITTRNKDKQIFEEYDNLVRMRSTYKAAINMMHKFDDKICIIKEDVKTIEDRSIIIWNTIYPLLK